MHRLLEGATRPLISMSKVCTKTWCITSKFSFCIYSRVQSMSQCYCLVVTRPRPVNKIKFPHCNWLWVGFVPDYDYRNFQMFSTALTFGYTMTQQCHISRNEANGQCMHMHAYIVTKLMRLIYVHAGNSMHKPRDPKPIQILQRLLVYPKQVLALN